MNHPSFPGSSSSRRIWKYDVFLSFRGEDTRNGFTARLSSALLRGGIFPFKDDNKIQKGDSISRELLKAIEQSRICIVVFSKHFANSTWCLNEVAEISQGISKPGYFVIPVFYHVHPSDVRGQRGDYRKFFDEHEKNFRDDIGRVQRWRFALTQVASLAGHEVQNQEEEDIIDNIARDVISKLGHRFSSLADNLVGMQPRAEALENLLDLESNDVRSVGIWGMPGIGKTTLAAVVYNKISHQFDASCLLLDVSRVHEGPGLVRLQKQLLREILQEDLEISEEHWGTDLISTSLRHLKTLIVVDNVDHAEQLEKLVGKSEWFGPGSRIIITTRDEYILRDYGVDKVYTAELLKHEEALQLFCRIAFRRDDPLRDFQEVTDSLLEYAKALPVAIKVLGSILFMRPISEWLDYLKKLKVIPNREVMGILETSFDRLDKEVKDIFIDIACFFRGAEEKYVKDILDHCGFNSAVGIRVLRERSLINVVNDTLWMHDMLRDLGWKFARGEFTAEPSKWSRLWSYEDLQTVKTGTEKVKAIVLNQQDKQQIPLKAEVLSEMNNLRLLILPDVEFKGKLNNLSNKLRFLSWQKFPFRYLPSTFEPATLVELIMPDSNITQLWQGTKILPSLRSIDLSGSKGLIKIPDLSGVKNLEKLNLEGCTGLLQIDTSVGTLRNLLFVNLRKCTHLISIPNNLFLLSSLQTLNISGCSRLGKTFPYGTWTACISL